MRTLLLNLRTGTKLALAFFIVALGFIVLLWLAFAGMEQLDGNTRLLTERYHPAMDELKEMRLQFNGARSSMMALMLTVDADVRAEHRKSVQRRTDEYETALAHAKELLAGNPEKAALLLQIDQLWQQFNATRDQQFELLARGQEAEVRAQLLGVQSEREELLRKLAQQLSTAVEQDVGQLVSDGKDLIGQLQLMFMVIGAALVLLTLLLAWLLGRAIVGPLRQVTDWAQQISGGEIPREISFAQREDEVGQLGQAFSRMSEYLQQLARSAEQVARGELDKEVTTRSERDVLGQAFAKMVANLRQLTSELHEGIAVLATASEEIMTSVNQTATSTQETATAISEIATTVEEVKQTAVLAGGRAKGVSESAERTKQVAQDGRDSVDETLRGMAQIREQMQAIGESIMRLGEQTQTIGEIVAAVNDLAEQSNLLGVNASIEAVKAGEAGKGFAVVAQEVKALAEQSKKATAQVRAILSDVQKAMTKAVLVAEQGSKTVESGYQRAQVSGDAIRSLSANATESSDMAMQIAATSQQQMVGMDQVAVAMENIRVASQDNVSGIRQVEQAARNLHQLGSRLKQAAAQFRL